MLSTLDLVIIGASLAIALGIGLLASRHGGDSSAEFFLSGRNTPWWLLGTSMVATTFSADTPNLVTNLVRQDGIAGNWVWWAFALTGMTTVFIYSRLWRRSNVTTDLEFYELRYSGKGAAFLRGFRAVYLGFFYNVIIMAMVMLAGTKIAAVLLGLPPLVIVVMTSVVTLVIAAHGGLRAVLWTDLFQFVLAMTGSIGAAYVIVNLPEVGGLQHLLENPTLQNKLSLLPDFTDRSSALAIFIIPLAVQWWSAWYPGAEPGGGGYVAQRMLSAKNEQQALSATLLFNIAHYALRPWPWILVALASLIVFPDLSSLASRFPHIDSRIVGHDLAYPAMLTFLPSGLMGLVVASLLAAVLSTLLTHVNWGSSYIVNDCYRRFINPHATERRLVAIGRWSSVALMLAAALLSLLLSSALQVFNILLQIGAGTGLIFMARWFWWRVNAYCEVAAMIGSFVIALYFEILHPLLSNVALPAYVPYLMNVTLTTVLWVSVAFLGPPTDPQTLASFAKRVSPYGRGWKRFVPTGVPQHSPGLAGQVLSVLLGLVLVYSMLFGLGFYLFGNIATALIALITAAASAIALTLIWTKSASVDEVPSTPLPIGAESTDR